MNFSKYTYSIIAIICTILLILNFVSCDYLIKNKEVELAEDKVAIKTDQNEAKLLVEASKYNLDIIELCNIIENKKVDRSIKKIVKEVKKEQLKILDRYNELASDNVISLPRYSDILTNVDAELESKEDLKIYLNLMNVKIYNQKDLLAKLYDTTNNSSFKVLVEYANESLQKSLRKTNQTLEKLNIDT